MLKNSFESGNDVLSEDALRVIDTVKAKAQETGTSLVVEVATLPDKDEHGNFVIAQLKHNPFFAFGGTAGHLKERVFKWADAQHVDVSADKMSLKNDSTITVPMHVLGNAGVILVEEDDTDLRTFKVTRKLTVMCEDPEAARTQLGLNTAE